MSFSLSPFLFLAGMILVNTQWHINRDRLSQFISTVLHGDEKLRSKFRENSASNCGIVKARAIGIAIAP